MILNAFEAVTLQDHLFRNTLYNTSFNAFNTLPLYNFYSGGGDGYNSIDDEEDEQFEDEMQDENDLHEIQVNDDLHEPDPEDDDHLPDEELQ